MQYEPKIYKDNEEDDGHQTKSHLEVDIDLRDKVSKQ